jgi:NADPH-dependent ferric siderophore reductase
VFTLRRGQNEFHLTGEKMETLLERHLITRVRREPRRRVLTVTSRFRLTPRMLRVGFVSESLRDFESASPDDHLKLFVPVSGAEPAKRDFTPRAFDTNKGSLTIDFALHEAGPATQWAERARAGDTIEIGGPRGSTVVPDDFDWYLLIGDETALPAIGRWVERLRSGVPITTLAIVADVGETQSFRTEAAHTPIWVYRPPQSSDDASTLMAALAKYQFPPGEGFIWVAAEGSVARSVRNYLSEVRRHPRSWMNASGYWKRGVSNAHEKIDD